MGGLISLRATGSITPRVTDNWYWPRWGRGPHLQRISQAPKPSQMLYASFCWQSDVTRRLWKIGGDNCRQGNSWHDWKLWSRCCFGKSSEGLKSLISDDFLAWYGLLRDPRKIRTWPPSAAHQQPQRHHWATERRWHSFNYWYPKGAQLHRTTSLAASRWLQGTRVSQPWNYWCSWGNWHGRNQCDKRN